MTDIKKLEEHNEYLLKKCADLEEELAKLEAEYLMESMTIGGFSAFSMPLIAKIFPKMTIDDLVSVQPMTQPSWVNSYYKGNIK